MVEGDHSRVFAIDMFTVFKTHRELVVLHCRGNFGFGSRSNDGSQLLKHSSASVTISRIISLIADAYCPCYYKFHVHTHLRHKLRLVLRKFIFLVLLAMISRPGQSRKTNSRNKIDICKISWKWLFIDSFRIGLQCNCEVFWS